MHYQQCIDMPYENCFHRIPLHPLVIILTFLLHFYFIRGEKLAMGTFLYIYAMCKGRKSGNGKGMCTRAADRVHTVGGVSSDTLL